MITFTIFIISICTYYVFYFYAKVKKYPPGPRPLPIIGNLHQLNLLHLDDDFERLSKKFGSTFTVFMPFPFVIIMDMPGIREAYSTRGDDFNGKPQNLFNELVSYNHNTGIINCEGENWKEQRRVTITILRDFGMGRTIMEEQVKRSIREFLNYIEKINDTSNIDLRWPLQLLVGNIVNETLFGYHYSYDNCDRLKEYIQSVGWMFGELAKSRLFFLILQYPILKYIPFIGHKAIGRLFAAEAFHKRFIKSEVEKTIDRKINIDPNGDLEPSNFIEAYIEKMKTNPNLSLINLYSLTSDLFTAGMETTTTTLRWSLLFMADRLDVQEKVRYEIQSIIGSDRLPSMSDKPSMIYTSATLMEIQRVASIVIPIGAVHRSVIDSEVNGHRIPQDTLVAAQLGSAMQNEKIFNDHGLFIPERFINADGKTINKDMTDYLIPFGVGKRQCAGEGLARMELFLVFTSIIQKYRIEPTDGGLDMGYDYTIMKVPRSNTFKLSRI